VPKPPGFWQDSLLASFAAAVISGVPSTLYAGLRGRDPFEAVRAVASILVSPASSPTVTLLSAALVHLAVSLVWTLVLRLTLPARNKILWATLVAVGIAIFDLRIIGRVFPLVHALDFWPQMADHLLWGTVVGSVLGYRDRMRSVATP
jgi:hypothetical protein